MVQNNYSFLHCNGHNIIVFHNILTNHPYKRKCTLKNQLSIIYYVNNIIELMFSAPRNNINYQHVQKYSKNKKSHSYHMSKIKVLHV